MKKSIWLAAGIAGMLLGNPVTDVKEAVGAQVVLQDSTTFTIQSRPTFIMLTEQGFSVAIGSPYDIVYYDNRYYINQEASWYRSETYRGPWELIREKDLPSRIKKYSLVDIRLLRETEYNRMKQAKEYDQGGNDVNGKGPLELQRSQEYGK